jgi:peptidyl-prolyl cis-trans isomerase-like 4
LTTSPFQARKIPSESPVPTAAQLKTIRIADDLDLDEADGLSEEEVAASRKKKLAKAQSTILEMVGDIADADVAPPDNVLFVCKLNPVTADEDLELIFSRFGKIVSCEVIRDFKTKDSLQYAFVEFQTSDSAGTTYE